MEYFRPEISPAITRARALRIGFISAIISIAIMPCGCSQSHNRPPEPVRTPIVRVLVLENKALVKLSAVEPPSVFVGSGQPKRLELTGGSSADVVLTPSGWKVGDADLGAGVLFVQPATEGTVSVDGHPYRGQYRFVPRAGGKFDVVNDVDVEAYLMGVIAKEMFPNWHQEAYRAQAIVARTYALYVSRTAGENTGYDLTADTRSQVYGGIAGETPKSRDAVDATRGMVVAYGSPGQERIFKAYFSSCCGGVTQSAAAAFGDPASEPLSEQQTSCCTASPRYSWATVTMSKSEITRRLRVWGANNNAPEKTIGDVARIDILTTNRFGRPESFAITDARGYRYRLGSEDFRIGLNTDAGTGVKIQSSFCRPVNDSDVIRFTEGHGFGHGVGLCQWCAEFQAAAGESHTQIVLKAFPKSVIVEAY